MSPPFFSRVGNFPFNEMVVNCGHSLARTNGNMTATNGYPACQQNGANKIQCHRKGCSSSFPDVKSLREHSKGCALTGTSGYRCIFLECTEPFVAPNLYALVIHQRVHQTWSCTAKSCARTFTTKDNALKHTIKDHHNKPPSDSIKAWWIPQRNQSELPRQPGTFFDISEIIGDWEAECIGEDFKVPTKLDTSLSRGGVSEYDGDSVPSEDSQGLSLAVFAHITSQLTALSDLLDNQSLVPTSKDHRQLSQTLQIMQDKLNNKLHASQQPCKNRYLGLPGAPTVGSVRRHDTIQGENFTAAVAATEASATQPSQAAKQRKKNPNVNPKASHEISPVEEEDERDLPGADMDSDEELEIPPGMRRVDGEPVQHTHLSGLEQRTYFNEMQQCCVAAAFQFYRRYQDHLDNIKDRKQRQLCLTAKSGPIMKADDLSLPHWTHLLRRISDARGLQKHMVSRIESFNGDISPVDEVRHAYTKSKVKSDRDLLALLQLTRNFCWQLKDWDKCADLDTLYTVLEKTIRNAKKKNMEGFSRPTRKGTFSGRKERPVLPSPGRQSATWPRMQEVEGGS